MPKISIIIPIYNAEKYLKEALDSCVGQTMTDIEILLIDDCSVDKSTDIMHEYATKYDNIRLFFQKQNKRQGAARNVGIKNAEGDYILFLDSDDWLSLDACEKLYQTAIEHDADMVAGDCEVVCPNRRELVKIYDDTVTGDLDYVKRERLMGMRGLHVCRLYKRRMLLDNNIFYPEAIFFEDAAFNTMTKLCAKNMYKANTVFYFYRFNEDSTCNVNIEHHYQFYDVAEWLIDQSKQNGLLEDYKEIIYNKVVGNYYNALSAATVKADKKAMEVMYNIKRSYNELKKDKQFDVKASRFVKLNSISPRLLIAYCWLAKTIKKQCLHH